jgi:hypothetical protein
MNQFLDHFLAEYLCHGLSQIYEIDSSYHESEAGFGSHDHKKTVVACKGDQFVKVSAHEHAWFGFNGGRSLAVTSEEAISEPEYLQLINGKSLLDTLENVRAVKGHQDSILRRYQAQDELNAIKHQCPLCESRMRWTSGKFGPFWGCAKYPDCRGTRDMTAVEKRLYGQYAGEDEVIPNP